MKISDNLKKLTKNIKGFTLVELLVTVVILGLLSGVAIVSVTSTQTKSFKEYDQKQNELFTTAAQSYYQDNRVILTNLKLLNTSEVNLQTLMDQNYIDKVVDYKKKEYDYQKSKAYVKKTGTGKYIYYSELYGKDGKLRVTNKPSDNKKSSGITIEIKNYKNATSQAYSEKDKIYYVNDKIDIDIYLKGGISSYQYYIKRGDKNYKKSGEIGVDKEEYSDTIKLDVKDFANGSYKLEVVAYGYDGGVTSKQGATIVVDKIKPKCKISLDGEKGNEVEGLKDIYWYKSSNKFANGNNVVTLKMKITETNKWKNRLEKTEYEKNRSLLSNNISEKGEISKNQDQDTDNKGQKWYGAIEDKAGNLGYCDTIVYLDRELPSCSTEKTDFEPKNAIRYKDWTNASSYTAVRSCSDKYSGCTNDTSGPEKIYVKVEEGKTNNSKLNFNITTVKDKAGNEKSCDAQSTKVDREKPTCSFDISGTKGNSYYGGTVQYYKSDVTVSITANDNKGSGIGGTGISIGNPLTEITEQTKVYLYNEFDNNVYGYVVDNVGNTNTCVTKNIRVDTIKPTCTANIESNLVERWTKDDVEVRLDYSPHKDISYYDWYTKKTNESDFTIRSRENAPDVIKYLISTGKRQGKAEVYDFAGNSGSCTSKIAYIDKTDPVISAYPSDDNKVDARNGFKYDLVGDKKYNKDERTIRCTDADSGTKDLGGDFDRNGKLNFGEREGVVITELKCPNKDNMCEFKYHYTANGYKHTKFYCEDNVGNSVSKYIDTEKTIGKNDAICCVCRAKSNFTVKKTVSNKEYTKSYSKYDVVYTKDDKCGSEGNQQCGCYNVHYINGYKIPEGKLYTSCTKCS